MTKTNALFVTGSINPERGGVARVCCNLANGFKEYGIDSYSISEAIDSEGYFADSIQFEDPHKISQKNQIQILSYFEQYRFSFVIIENPQIEWMLNAVSVLKGKTIIIGEFHNSPYGYYSNFGNNPAFNKYYTKSWFRKLVFYVRIIGLHRYWSSVAKTLDHMVLLSNAYYEELIKLAFFPREKVSVIPNPFPSVVYDSNVNKQNWMLFVGRLHGVHKGLQQLMEIWNRLSVELPTWHLMIVGGGNELPKWKEVAAKMDLKNIHFEDFQSPVPYYTQAKLFLMTSLFEGFPMTLVEAMQYGCVPVVFDSFAAVGDIVDHKIDGLVIRAFDENEYVDSVLNLVNNEEVLERYSQNAIKKTEKFEVDQIVKKWVDLFQQISSS